MPEIIRWPDDSTEPLTPELGAALTAIVAVFGPDCRVEGSRPTKSRPETLVYWRDRDPQKSTSGSK